MGTELMSGAKHIGPCRTEHCEIETSGLHNVLASESRHASAEQLIHDWNRELDKPGLPKVFDETLRDGLQSPSVRDPSIGEKLELLHCMVALGIDGADLGIPCARAKQYDDVARLVQEIARERLPIGASCAARTCI
jgi:2-isopropylmalate synthase